MPPIVRTLERPVAGARPDRAHARVSRSQWAEWVAGAALVVGGAVRIEQFLWRRSLWLDEALVANNIVARSYGGLLHQLDGKQGAPIGWLWVQRTMVLIFGNNEYALRLVPLAAGIAAVALVHSLARHVLGPWPAAAAAWMLALSPQAVRYSVEVKQYSSDLAVSAALIFLALQSVERKVLHGRQDRRAILAWGWLAAFAVWWSHPAIFVVAGTAVMLAVDAIRRDGIRGRDARVVVRASVPWVLSFALDWFVSLRPLGHDPFLRAFWSAGYPPKPIGPGSLLSWLVRAPAHLVVDPGGIVLTGLGAVVVVVGLLAALLRRPIRSGMVTAPFAVGLAAACAGSYPLRGRLALWVLPVLYVGLAGILALALNAKRPAVVAGATALVVVIGWAPAAAVFGVARHPTTFQDTRPLLQAVHRQLRPGDQVWVHAEDNAAMRFYGFITGTVLTHEVQDRPADLCVGNPNLRSVGSGHRVWFIYAYHGSDAPIDEEPVLVEHLRSAGHLLEQLERPAAHAYLFDFSAAPDVAGVGIHDIPCVTVTVAPTVRPTGLKTGVLGTGRSV